MESLLALTNPISKFLDKPREEFMLKDFIKVIKEKKIERIGFHYTGLDGKLKELKMPLSSIEQVEQILADGERVDGSSLFKNMVDTSLSDLYVIPVYKTAFLNPFDDKSLDFICRYMTDEGKLAPFSLDNILLNAYELFRKNTGLELYALGELEFFLVYPPSTTLYPAPRQRGYQASSPFVKSGSILNEMLRTIAQITGAVKYAHSEVGYIEKVRSDSKEIKDKEAEQLEIEFLPKPIDDAGDFLVLSRWLIRNIAFNHGCVATFAPKLEEGVAGNGLHIHSAIMKDGKNAMVTDEGQLSEAAHRLIGGLCHYADSLTAFGNTVSSAYLRLVPNQEAPTRICWSYLNRSAMIRVPLGWSQNRNLAQRLNPQELNGIKNASSRQTVELRIPDGSAIVYLLLAGITLAAEWGLREDEALLLAEKNFVEGNIFKNSKLLKSLLPLPQSCVESAKILVSKRELYERNNIFPPSVIDYVSSMLVAEDDMNINQHLADLPADDRLHETRKFMHKNLHKH